MLAFQLSLVVTRHTASCLVFLVISVSARFPRDLLCVWHAAEPKNLRYERNRIEHND